jgi:hypothetical protein
MLASNLVNLWMKRCAVTKDAVTKDRVPSKKD